MNFLRSTLDNGYLTRWLQSEVRAESVSVPAHVRLVDAGDKAINPMREIYAEEIRKSGIPCPAFIDLQPGGCLSLLGSELRLYYRAPFGDPVIGEIADYPTPSRVTVAAVTIVEADEDISARAEWNVSGGAFLYIDGNVVRSFLPYIRNKFEKETFDIKLEKGRHVFIIIADDYAERDTECRVSLRFLTCTSSIYQIIPLGDRSPEILEKHEKALESLAFTRTCYKSGNVYLYMDNDFADSIDIELEGATEENEEAGVLCRRTAHFSPYSDISDLGPCESFPLGFLRFGVTAYAQDIRIETTRCFENFPVSFITRALSDVKGRKRQCFQFLAEHGEMNANRAVAILMSDGDIQEAEELLWYQVDFINRRCDCSDFYLPYFPYIIRHFSGELSEELLSAIKKCLLSFRYWMDEAGSDAMCFWSENHKLMFHTSQLLAGELYPDEIFTNSGMTGKEMVGKAKNLLAVWFDCFFKTGFSEWNSPPYLPIDSLGFASLYAMAEDSEVRTWARRGLDYIFRLLALTSVNGVFSTTSGRTYLKELMGNHSSCTSFMNWIAYGLGNESHAGKGVVSLALSDYECSGDNLEFARLGKGRAVYLKMTNGSVNPANVTVYKTSEYLLSAVNGYKIYKPGKQEDVVHAVVSADEHIWINHPGEFAIFGKARPSYWAGSSILPRVYQYRGLVSVCFQIPADCPVDFTHCYWPSFEFKRTDYQGNWAFAECQNGVKIGIFASNGLSITTKGGNMGRELISRGNNTHWLIRMAGSSIPFELFTSSLLSSDARICSSEIIFSDPGYGEIRITDYGLSVCGRKETYEGFSAEGFTEFLSDKGGFS